MTDSTLSPSAQIDAKFDVLDDWRGAMFKRLRALIHEAAPEVEETLKWRGTPVWEDHGIICTGETYKAKIKLTFLKGASLPDPTGIFNSSLEGNARRALDIHEADTVDAAAFKALIAAAVTLNRATQKTGP